jgi:uncharacterized protein (DUF1684 family)
MVTRINTNRAVLCLLAGLLTSLSSPQTCTGQVAYNDQIQAWREKRKAELLSEDGWLAVVGLYWLKQGSNSFGSDPANDIVLPSNLAPARLGRFEFDKGTLTLLVDVANAVLVNDQPVNRAKISSDETKKPDIIKVGDLNIYAIKRGERFGIRIKNKNSKQRREFTGLTWYPADERYRIAAQFVGYKTPKEIPIANVLGDVSMMSSPGYAIFEIGGMKQRLEPVIEGERLLFIFRDTTSGKSTYPAGRFLYADPAADGKVVLDFNRAINPPCAFTEFATCPLPPKQNWLKVAINAGELNYHLTKK